MLRLLLDLLPSLSLGVLIGRQRPGWIRPAALVVLRSTALALVTVSLWWWVLQNGLP